MEPARGWSVCPFQAARHGRMKGKRGNKERAMGGGEGNGWWRGLKGFSYPHIPMYRPTYDSESVCLSIPSSETRMHEGQKRGQWVGARVEGLFIPPYPYVEAHL